MIGDGVGLADGKGIPVDDSVLGPLIDREAIVRGRSDRRVAGGYRAALWQNAGRRPRYHRLDRRERHRGSHDKHDRAAQKTPRRTQESDRGSEQVFSSKNERKFSIFGDDNLTIFGFVASSTRRLFILSK
jgi:hypothetical protein